jgi:signal transduction histidine kinase
MGYGLVLALTAVPITIALAGIVRLGGAAEAILSENVQSIEAADAMADALERQDSGTLLLVLGDAGGARLVDRNAARFEAAFAQASANVTLAAEPALLSAIARTQADYAQALGALRADLPGAAERYRERVYPAFLVAREAVRALAEANRRAALAASERSQRVAGWATGALTAGAAAALGLGLLVSVGLSRRIARSEAELDRARRSFVATASHELKTPLTSLGMSLALLQERAAGLTARERALLDAAAEDAQRLNRLTADLLDLSRLESGAADLRMGAVAPADLLSEAARAVRAAAESRRVTLRVESPARGHAAQADPGAIVRVLVNLAGNAVRHTPPGGQITLRAQAADGEVRFAVADTGEGIPHDAQARIFDPFAQVEGAQTAGGSGLGLAICREIVRAHGGTLEVASEPGRGATFSFALSAAHPPHTARG